MATSVFVLGVSVGRASWLRPRRSGFRAPSEFRGHNVQRLEPVTCCDIWMTCSSGHVRVFTVFWIIFTGGLFPFLGGIRRSRDRRPSCWSFISYSQSSLFSSPSSESITVSNRFVSYVLLPLVRVSTKRHVNPLCVTVTVLFMLMAIEPADVG